MCGPPPVNKLRAAQMLAPELLSRLTVPESEALSCAPLVGFPTAEAAVDSFKPALLPSEAPYVAAAAAGRRAVGGAGDRQPLSTVPARTAPKAQAALTPVAAGVTKRSQRIAAKVRAECL